MGGVCGLGRGGSPPMAPSAPVQGDRGCCVLKILRHRWSVFGPIKVDLCLFLKYEIYGSMGLRIYGSGTQIGSLFDLDRRSLRRPTAPLPRGDTAFQPPRAEPSHLSTPRNSQVGCRTPRLLPLAARIRGRGYPCSRLPLRVVTGRALAPPGVRHARQRRAATRTPSRHRTGRPVPGLCRPAGQVCAAAAGLRGLIFALAPRHRRPPKRQRVNRQPPARTRSLTCSRCYVLQDVLLRQ